MSGTTPTGGPDDERPDDPYATPGSPLPPADQPPGYGSTQPPAGAPGWPSDQGGTSPYGQPAPAEPPQPLLNGVRLMYLGAALSLLGGLSFLTQRDALVDAGRDANEELSSGDKLTPDQIDAAANAVIGLFIGISVVAALIWLWMAAKNKQGRSWARTVATVLGGLNILFTVLSLGQGAGGVNLVTNLLSLALSVVILYFLYRPESSQYYAAQSQRR